MDWGGISNGGSLNPEWGGVKKGHQGTQYQKKKSALKHQREKGGGAKDRKKVVQGWDQSGYKLVNKQHTGTDRCKPEEKSQQGKKNTIG